MKAGFVALLGLLALPAAAHATVTVTTGPAGYYGSTTDAFDVSRGTVVTGISGYNGASRPENALGGISATSEPNALIFADNTPQLQTLSFRTAAPVNIAGVNFYLGQDGAGNGDIRGFDTIAFFGSLDGVTYTDLGSIDLVNPYESGYDSPYILVTSTFAPATYQYFRFEGTPYDSGSFSETYSGGRIFEIDAISAGAVPESMSWAMFIAGFSMIGGFARGRRTQRIAAA